MRKKTYIYNGKEFQHYRLLIIETPTKLYYVNSEGRIEYAVKKKVRVDISEEMMITLDTPDDLVYIEGLYIGKLDELVAKLFLDKQWYPRCEIIHLDKNPRNCNLLNLRIK